MKGIGVSPGISIGRALWMVKNTTTPTGIRLSGEQAIREEIDRYRVAVACSITELEALTAQTGPEAAAILETHIGMLSDPQLDSDILEKIRTDLKNASDAVQEVTDQWAQSFKNMEDEYLKERAVDLDDIGRRILKNLSVATPSSSLPSDGLPVILLAGDLTPSETITMDLSRVLGFAVRDGGRTSHAAIIARLRSLPAVVGCGETLNAIANDDLLILDGQTGLIIVNPNERTLQEYTDKKIAQAEQARLLQSLKDVPSIFTDGRPITLLANISKVQDLEDAFHQGAEGVGLFRTEFLFMQQNTFPTEEEQFTCYRDIALRCGSRPVTIRTLDIGGDKPLPYFPLPKEQNPFLGYRAIRISLDKKDLFFTQLKAILRASAFGQLKIMLPMITNVHEVRTAKTMVTEAKRTLTDKGIAFDPCIPLGIMVEVPSAAITADLLAREVDFFSIGTNDLCQYTLAVDRMNEKIKDLYDPYDPAVLRLISYVIEQAHKHKIPVSLCGELAADPLATLLLAGMGLEEFSMNAPSIPVIRNIIIHNSLETARAIYKKVMELDHSPAIIHYLQEVSI